MDRISDINYELYLKLYISLRSTLTTLNSFEDSFKSSLLRKNDFYLQFHTLLVTTIDRLVFLLDSYKIYGDERL